MKRRVTAHTRWITALTAVALAGCESTIWVPSAPTRDARDASVGSDDGFATRDASEPQGVVFEDDFTRGLDRWEPFGEPAPVVLRDTLERPAVFDNHGDGTCDSGAATTEVFDLSRGFTLEADLRVDVTNPAGCWAEARFGVARENFRSGCLMQPEAQDMTFFGLEYLGARCTDSMPEHRRHAWLKFAVQTEHGEFVARTGSAPVTWGQLMISGDHLLDAWHRYTVRVDTEGWADYSVDGRLIVRSPGR